MPTPHLLLHICLEWKFNTKKNLCPKNWKYGYLWKLWVLKSHVKIFWRFKLLRFFFQTDSSRLLKYKLISRKYVWDKNLCIHILIIKKQLFEALKYINEIWNTKCRIFWDFILLSRHVCAFNVFFSRVELYFDTFKLTKPGKTGAH